MFKKNQNAKTLTKKESSPDKPIDTQAEAAQDNYAKYLDEQLNPHNSEGEYEDYDLDDTNGPIRISENRILGQYKTPSRQRSTYKFSL